MTHNKVIQKCIDIAGSRYELSELAGVSYMCVVRWLKGDFYPSPDRALKMEKELNKIIKKKGLDCKIGSEMIAPNFDWEFLRANKTSD